MSKVVDPQEKAYDWIVLATVATLAVFIALIFVCGTWASLLAVPYICLIRACEWHDKDSRQTRR